ncbi:MAG: 30S ribosomal protein S3 [bacterium]
MGQKIHPFGFRVGITKNWTSRWFMKRGSAESVIEDIKIRRLIHKHLVHAQISKIEIEKASSQTVVTIHTARPGLVIGQKGATIDALREDISTALNKDVKVNVSEVKKPFLDAQIASEMAAVQIERKMPFRSICKKLVKNVTGEGALGAKIMVSGRLGGAEIARREWFKDGSVPLQSLFKDIDYGFSKAYTRYGIIGVKVWIHRKEEVIVEPVAVPAAEDESAAPLPTEKE